MPGILISNFMGVSLVHLQDNVYYKAHWVK